LFNHDGLTQDGISEAFIEFAKKEKLSFFKLSPSVKPFDADKYQQLMDGLEAAVINLSELERTHRIDSEFFRKEYLEASTVLNTKIVNPITNFVKVFDGNHMKISESFTDSGVPYYRGQDMHHFFIEQSSPIYIDTEAYNLPYMKRSHLKKGDVLLSIVGTIGSVSLVKTNQNATCNCKLAILRTKSTKPEYLASFLKSKFGQSQIQRFTRGAVQMGLILEDMNQIVIPEFSNEFENTISSTVLISNNYLNQSDIEYQQAEDLLLSELRLNDWQPIEETVAVKSFSESFLSSGRLDAEYYQPKYDQVEEAIQECGSPSQNLGPLIESIQNGFDYREYTEEGTPYIRVGDVKNGKINFERAVKVPITMADVNKSIGLQVGDILFTRKGSFGNSAVVTELEVNGIISSEIMLVRLTSLSKQTTLPEYISLFLNSKFGYLQVERRVHGVAYYSIAQPDLANLLIPILPKKQQQKIVDKIKSSFSIQLRSHQLLEIAKTGVERAIETDEAIATTWMNQQLKTLGVDLS